MEEVVNKVKELLFDKLDYIHSGNCRFYDWLNTKLEK